MDAIARSRPVLTLAIPTYERSASLSRLLHCLVAQAGIDRVEVLISDNGSTDGTRAAAAAFSDDLSIRIVGFDRNQGFDKNYHNCVVLARTEYVWVMGDDDLLTPGAVARILSAIDMNHPDLIICQRRRFQARRVGAENRLPSGRAAECHSGNEFGRLAPLLDRNDRLAQVVVRAEFHTSGRLQRIHTSSHTDQIHGPSPGYLLHQRHPDSDHGQQFRIFPKSGVTCQDLWQTAVRDPGVSRQYVTLATYP